MDEVDRATITRNFVALIQQTNLDALLPKLVERGIFTEDMIQEYLRSSTTPSERKRQLYLDVQRRGPQAFKHLLDSLFETGHIDLVRLLKPNFDIQRSQNDPNPADNQQRLAGLQIPKSVLSLRKKPLEVKVILANEWRDNSTPEGLQAYRMRSRPRGKLFMINNINFNNHEIRRGAEVDEKNFSSLFQQLGFIVEKHRNQGLEDMRRKITEFARREEHKHYDCCVVAIMSHGHSMEHRLNSTLVAIDGQELPVDWVLEQFSSHNAQYLMRIPKLFFFQACRGDEQDFGTRLTQHTVEYDGRPQTVVPHMSDMLVGFSTMPGFTSHRDIHLGTWYIERICDVFMNHAHSMDVQSMLQLVNQELEGLESEKGSLQTSPFDNRGFRKLYFNPGLYVDSSENGFHQ